MDSRLENVTISGISSFVPAHIENNNDYISLLNTRRVKKQIRLTGVEKRHTSTLHQRSSDFAYAAAESILDELGWEKNSIGILIFVTQGADYVVPSTAIALQDRLGLDKQCLAFDINLGCSAFNYGVHTAASILSSALNCRRALCLVADSVPGMDTRRDIDINQISFSLLVGSAGAAIALEKKEGTHMLFSGICDGSRYDAIIQRSAYTYTDMKGNQVFDYAINEVSDSVIDFKKKNQLEEEDIDYYVFHQAQKLILDSIADACSLPEEKVLISYDEYGNTSGASVPLTLCANKEKISQKDRIKVLFCGFGVGLSSGITYLEMDTKHILDVKETDAHWDKDKEPDNILYEETVLLLDADTKTGEFLASFLDKMSATLILCGHNEEKLMALQKNIFFESSIVVHQTPDELVAKINELTDVSISGIVGKEAVLIAKSLEASSVFGEEKRSVVVLCNTNDGNMDIGIEDLTYRVNMVQYDSTEFEFPEEVSTEFYWPLEYFTSALPEKMTKPNYLGYSVAWLLYKDSKMISGSTIIVK